MVCTLCPFITNFWSGFSRSNNQIIIFPLYVARERHQAFCRFIFVLADDQNQFPILTTIILIGCDITI